MNDGSENFWKRQRTKLGISQRQLAVRLGVSNNTVSAWEKGDAIPELSRAPSLAREFSVSPSRVEQEIVALHRQLASSSA